MYHVYGRGVNRGRIFFEDQNYDHFLYLFQKHVTPIAKTYAYCLLINHYHFLLSIRYPRECGFEDYPFEISQKFSNFFNAYAKAINKAYGRVGSLFVRPFRRKPVLTNHYAMRLAISIHRNPSRHEIARFEEWKYSSYPLIAGRKRSFIESQDVIGWLGSHSEFVRQHRNSMFDTLP